MITNLRARVSKLERTSFAGKWEHLANVPVNQWPDEALTDAILDGLADSGPEMATFVRDLKVWCHGDHAALDKAIADLFNAAGTFNEQRLEDMMRAAGNDPRKAGVREFG